MNTKNAPDKQSKPLEIAVIGIFCLLLLQASVWASDFLIPVTAAFLGYFVLNRPRRLLARIGIPPVAAAVLFTSSCCLACPTQRTGGTVYRGPSLAHG